MTLSREDIERIVRMEGHILIHKDDIEQLVNNIATLNDSITNINRAMSRYIGFIGGISFAFSILGSGVVAVVYWAMKKTGVA